MLLAGLSSFAGWGGEVSWLLISCGDAPGTAQPVSAGSALQPDLPMAVTHLLLLWGRRGCKVHSYSLRSCIYSMQRFMQNPWCVGSLPAFISCPFGFPLFPGLLMPKPVYSCQSPR